MDVKFDARKNAQNIQKHGISLQRAEDFDMESALLDQDNSQDYGETRYTAIGWIAAGLHNLIFTFRGGVCRPISLRKATKQEHKSYAEENQ